MKAKKYLDFIPEDEYEQILQTFNNRLHGFYRPKLKKYVSYICVVNSRGTALHPTKLACHASALNYTEGKTNLIQTFFEDTNNKTKAYIRREYKEYIRFMLYDHPFSKYILNSSIESVVKNGFVISCRYTPLAAQLCLFQAFRIPTEMKNRYKLWRVGVEDLGINPLIMYVLCHYLEPSNFSNDTVIINPEYTGHATLGYGVGQEFVKNLLLSKPIENMLPLWRTMGLFSSEKGSFTKVVEGQLREGFSQNYQDLPEYAPFAPLYKKQRLTFKTEFPVEESLKNLEKFCQELMNE